MAATPYFYRHENPNAPRQSNGLRFWGYPTRQGGINAIRVLAVHTAENVPDVQGADSSAENLAAYGSRMDRAASWHVCTDRDSRVRCLPDRAVAFHVGGFNTPSLGLEICTQAHRWGRNRRADAQLLRQAAWVYARWSIYYRIPRRWLSRAQALNTGMAGFVRHSTMDPARRSDPGQDFPGALFFRMVERRRRLLRAAGVRPRRPKRR